MGIGVISLQTSQKKEVFPSPVPPPFAADSARNGLSVDTTGRIVLGNDIGDINAPAVLLSNRQIDLETIAHHFQILLNAAISTVRTILTGDSIVMDYDDVATATIQVGNLTAVGTISFIQAITGLFGSSLIQARNDGTGASLITSQVDTAGTGGLAALRVGAGGQDVLDITAGDIVGRVQFRVRGSFTTQIINTTTFCTLFQSDTPAGFNGATVQVSGTHTYRKFDQSQNGVLNLDRDLDSAKVLRNSGALTINFPNFVGANFREGFFVDVLVFDAGGITVNAGAGRTIHFGDLATSVNGTVSSTNVGSCIRIIIADSTTFFVQSITGLWSLT